MSGLGNANLTQLKRGKVFGEIDVASILLQVCLGLEYLHGLGKIHRDIKAANILMTTEGNVKLAGTRLFTKTLA